MSKIKRPSQKGKKGTRGRPSIFSSFVSKKICELVRKGRTYEQIAEIMGVTSATVRSWKRSNTKFSFETKEAELIATELVEARLFERATGYSHPETKVSVHQGVITTKNVIKHHPPDTQAAVFWLKNRSPKKWKERVTLISDESNPIDIIGPDGKTDRI